MLHVVYDSQIYKVVVTNTLVKDELVPYLQEIVELAAQLNILDVKKADVLDVIQSVLDKLGLTTYIRKVDKDFDLSTYDLDSISFKADAEIYASMVPYAYDVIKGLYESGLNTAFLANTDAIYALVEIYTIAIETTLVQSFAEKAFAVIDKLNAKLPITISVNEEEVLYNISDFLFGLVELGVFSNNGIDLTNTATIEMMKQAVLNSVDLPAKLEKLVNMVCARLYAYGVVPFNWDVIDAKAEVKLAKEVAKLALSFVKENASSIKAKDLSMFADPEVQADLTEMLETLSESSFVQQLFFPVLEGTFKALTLKHTDGEMIYDGTIEDIINESMPNFWAAVNAVYEITGFKRSNINAKALLSNLDAVATIVELLATDRLTKDNIAKVMITGIEVFTSVKLSAEEKAQLCAIDFANEVQYSNAFFEALQETYNETNFTLSLASIKNADVLNGLADALEAVLESETVKVLVKTGAKAVNSRVVKKVSTEMYELVKERLSDETLTNEQLIEDLYKVVELMRQGAAANVIGNTADFTAWNFDALKEIISLCFATNVANGYENEFAEIVINRVPQLKDYYDGSVQVNDWEAEALAIVNVLESLVADGFDSFDNINVDSVSSTTIEYILDSVILSDLIIDMLNERLEEKELNEYYVVTKESLEDVEDWAAELEAIQNLTELMNAINSGSVVYSEVVNQYETIRNNTVLVNDVLTAAASHIVPKMPVVKDYYDSTIVIADWTAELDAIVATLKQMDAADASSFANPLDKNSPITGAVVEKAVESAILRTAMVDEMNAAIYAAGLSENVITEADVLAVTDWDKELSAMRELVALDVEAANLAEIIDVYYVVKETILCDKVLVSSAEILVPDFPMVSDYYNDSMIINDWSAELDSIVNAFESLDGKNIATMENPIENLNGEIIVTCLNSVILKAAFIVEFNNNLNVLGLGSYYTLTEEKVNALDTAAKWDLELEAITMLETLVEKLSNLTITQSELLAVYNKCNETVIAKEILNALLADFGIVAL